MRVTALMGWVLLALVQFWTGYSFQNSHYHSSSKFHNTYATAVFLPLSAASKSDNETIEKYEVLSKSGRNAIPASSQKDSKSNWDSFKSSIYATVDGVGSVTKKLRQGDPGPGVQGGYSNIEKSVLNSNENISPGQRLMSQYKQSRSFSSAAEDTAPETSENAFDAFKSVIYGTADAASQAFSSEGDSTEATLDSFKPLVQSKISSPEIQKALPDLQSNNPIKRRRAESKIKNWEQQEKKRQLALQREENARKFKESIYQVGDAVVWSVETLAKTPAKISGIAKETKVLAKKVKKSVNTVPNKVEAVVKTTEDVASSVATIPTKVKQSSNNVKSSVEESVEKTKKFIDDVQKIPSNVEKSVKETKEKVDGAVAFVDETTTRVKVLAGLEKPKPKPPKVPPPPPPTAADIGWKVAGTVASGSAKLAWWAGKGVAVTAWNGVSSALKKSGQEKSRSPTLDKLQSQSLSSTKDQSKEKKVDKDVEEALKLAQSALNYADKETKSEQDSGKDRDNDKGTKQ